MDLIICPMCKKRTLDADNVQHYSISRRKDRPDTKICNSCGMIEAFEDMP